jgi:DNA-binding beta-propeller fold protein YncE
MQRSFVASVIAFVLLIASQHAQAATAAGKHIISTVAGSGAFCQITGVTCQFQIAPPCGDDGLAIDAAFFSPRGLAATPGGGYLVADRFDNRIRQVSTISPEAIITTIAGTGAPCFPRTDPCGDNGPAVEAQLTIPREISLTDGGGYLIADEGDHRIRHVSAISSDGIITTVAGTGVPCPVTTDSCGDGGPATAAQLNFPHNVLALSNGEFWIADSFDNRVRKVSADGTITMVAGTGVPCDPAISTCGDNGPAIQATLNNPHGLALTRDGGFLIAAALEQRIRKVSADGIITTVAGTGEQCTDPTDPCGDGGAAIAAQLSGPRSIAVMPNGGFLFTDARINRVRQVSPNGKITTIAGSGEPCTVSTDLCGDGGQALAAELNGPQDILPTRGGGFLITDGGDTDGPDCSVTNRIRLVAPPGLHR